MTEIGIVLSNPLDGERRPGSVEATSKCRCSYRRFGDDVPVRDGDIGEVQIKGPSVFDAYLNRPEASRDTIVDGWMKTGDLGYRSKDGYYTLVGRNSDMLISGGLNVYPAEVSNLLCEHPSVTEAAVFGLPDADLGERVVAVVVTSGDPGSLADWLKSQLTGYKRPKEFRFAAALPRNAMGKVDRAAVRAGWDTYSPTAPGAAR